MYAIHLTPNSSTRVVPYTLVNHRELHSTIELLYSALFEQCLEHMDLSKWTEKTAY